MFCNRNDRGILSGFLTVIVTLVLTGAAMAADWPQWRGQNRDAKSADTGLLQEWPQGGPPLAWKAENLGGGDTAPSIANGRIFGMGNRDDEEVVWCLSEKDGSEIWATPLGPAYSQRASQSKEGPGCTPTVDGDRLYVEGLAGNVACLQIADGKILWQISMTEKFGGRVPRWSYRESPLVDGDKLICTPGGEDAMMVALNKMTGETIWKSKLPESPAGDSEASGGPGGRRGGRGGRRGFGGFGGGGGAAYASVIAIDFEGQR